MSQATSQSNWRLSLPARWIAGGVAVLLLILAAVFSRQWLPAVQRILTSTEGASETTEKSAGGLEGHEHEGHDHAHAGHEEGNSIELSAQARKNIGLGDPVKVALQDFTKTISVPGVVVERPGRSTVELTAPMTGVITRIYPIEGEAVEAGVKLFDMRLTHEELVQLQTDLLKSAEELEVVQREIQRIEKLIAEQALPGKQMLERQYEQKKIDAAIRATSQALLLHGLTPEQVNSILREKRLLEQLSVSVPTTPDDGMSPAGSLFQIQDLKVSQGQAVTTGEPLATLSDHSELYIEGEAFARDLQEISRAAEKELPVSAILETNSTRPEIVSNLRLLYLAAKVDPERRTLDFFVRLPNERLTDKKLPDGHRFITWRFRPGQRVQLQIPFETLPKRIVLPAEAVAQEGPEAFVFTPNGDHFDRRKVHVEFRDPTSVVIANDGSLFPGDLVAPTGATQLQLALKNKAGGGIDPHAGHNH